MPTETGTIDLKAQKAGHDDAAKTATKYITDIGAQGISVSGNNATSSVEIASTVKVKKSAASYSEQTADGLNVYADESGSAVLVGRFGADGAQIGLTDESHLSLDYRSMQLVDKEGDTYFHVSDLRMEDGSIVAEFTGNGTTTDYVLPVYPYSPSDGTNTSLTIDGVAKTYGTGGGDYTLADTPVFGILLLETPAAAGASIVLRYKPTESVNPKALTFGSRDANMSGMGAFSATFGSSCAAMSDNTIALNKGTIAYTPNQTAVGTYNEIDDNSKYALIIGNGTADNARSNALAVDWTGDVTRGVQFMERRLSANTTVSMSSTYSYTNVPLNTTAASSGTKLEASGNGIKVKEAGYYLISAGLVANAPYYGRVYADSDTMLTGTSNQAAHVGGGMGVTARYLAANTTIYLKICKTGTTNPTVAGSGLTFLSVIKIG